MTYLKTNSNNDIYSLMDEFPFLSFSDIREVALSLSIKSIYNEENTLTEKNYKLLKNKLLENAKNDIQDYNGYEEYEANTIAIDAKNFQFDKQVENIQKHLSIREIQLKHKLKEAFIFQSINLLNIKDIYGNSIDNTTDTNYIYVSEDDSKKIIKKTNQLNAMNANRNNQSSNNHHIPANTMTMNKLTEKEFTIFEELIQKDTLIFIDTSSLMNDEMPQIMNNEIIPVLKNYNKTVFITDSVINEIMVKINQTYNEENQRKAFSARDILAQLVQDDLYQIPQTHSVNKHFADAELISIFSDLRLKYNLCLITNDNSNKKGGGLSNCIMELQTSTCMDERTIKEITVLYIANKKLVKYSNNRDVNFKLHEKSPIRVLL